MNKIIKVRFSGQGGQGIIVASIILANAAILDGFHAIQTQSYGPQQRGGRLRSDVIISYEKPINYPVIIKADVLIAMTQEAYDVYGNDLSPEALILINSNQVKLNKKETNEIISVPATKMSFDLGNVIVANAIMIGVLICEKSYVTPDAVRSSIKAFTPKKHAALNIKAFELGLKLDYSGPSKGE